MAAEAQRRIALHRGTRQGPAAATGHHRTASLHHRGRIRRSAGGQSTLQHTEKPRAPNVKGRAAAGCALSGGEAGAGLECTRTARARSRRAIRGGPAASHCTEPPASTRAGAGRPPPCWRQCALPGAEPEDTAAAIPRRPARSQHGHSVTGPHSHRQRAEQAATARAHHGIDHRHLARGGHP